MSTSGNSGNISRRQQLQGSEDSLGRQQNAEDAEWPSLTRAEGTRQPWLATSLEGAKLRTEIRLRQGPSLDLPAKRKTQRNPGSWAAPDQPCHRRRRTVAHATKVENSGPCGVCFPQNLLFTHLGLYDHETIFGTVCCCPSGSWP